MPETKSKLKHNKKRNTAFLYEVLVREMTKAFIKKQNKARTDILEIIKKHFAKGTVLARELELYQTLVETRNISKNAANRLLQEVKAVHSKIDKKEIFKEQTRLINKINKALSKKTFSNFVPQYKSLATVYQIFNTDVPVREKILLEEGVIIDLSSLEAPPGAAEEVKKIDALVYKKFVERFNAAYGTLLEEQKKLLSRYVRAFGNGAVDFKVYLNEELSRLHKTITSSLSLTEVSNDAKMIEKTKKVLSLIEECKIKPLAEDTIMKILKMQTLAKEIEA